MLGVHWTALAAIAAASAYMMLSSGSEEDYSSCTVPRVHRISMRDFQQHFVDAQRPVVITGYEDKNRAFRAATLRAALSRDWGHLQVKLGTAHQYTKAHSSSTLRAYIDAMQPLTTDTAPGDAQYLFGEHNGPEWAFFLDLYSQPTHLVGLAGAAQSTLSFGVGAAHSGVPLHFHGHGFQETIHGRKRWYLYPPGQHTEVFDSNSTQLQWVRRVLPSLPRAARPMVCTVEPGELIYFPGQWMHGVLNLEPWTVFVSTFL
eukprot:TRINITY_DN50323_c0_g1_i2.p1 TRINITY_DN50323_c0_g1~~TRINITY_DN50323_c0_g1_i2.p1  ORF type:complete len:259 (-),score=71.25 TRINITY_DN50323_c0_g1_i2:13-789(-)